MKVLILLGLVAAAYASVGVKEPTGTFDPTYSIIEQHLIPLAAKIRKNEERMVHERITNGSPAVLGQFPFQVATLLSYQSTSGVGICGGSIVSPNRVIFAAHCWFDGTNQAWKVEVVAGSLTAFFGGVRQETSSVAMHPQFVALIALNDVAVIYLGTSLTFSANIAPIALPSGAQIDQDFSGQIGIASGFGVTETGSIATSLNFVPLNIISNFICSLSFPFLVQSSNICTSGAGGTSTCNGDSGGPLTVVSNGQTILVGITSFGSGAGCTVGAPAVFARVTSFLNFFNQHI